MNQERPDPTLGADPQGDAPFSEDDDSAATSFEPWSRPERIPWDDDVPEPGASTYIDAERGPEPVPDWVITSADARDTELGILKTGKEADVYVVERSLGDQSVIMAAKRYVPISRRSFRSRGKYQQGRRLGDSRAQRAADRGTSFGLKVEAAAWARNEMELLSQLWSAGVAVPYPVQHLGNELMLEYIGTRDEAAPRLVESRPAKSEVRSLYEQALEMFNGLGRAGIAHGDLSPYNLLVWEGRLVMIDLPQATPLASNPEALDIFRRDVENVCKWFQRQGVDTDEMQIFDDAIAEMTAP